MDEVSKRYKFRKNTVIKVKTHDGQVKDAAISPREGMMLVLFADGRVRATNGEWWRWCAFDAAMLESMVADGIIEDLGPPVRFVRRYKILKNIMLGFLGLREQHDEIIGPDDDVIIECDEHTIWAIKGERRTESITAANAMIIWIENGSIQELP